MGRRFGRRGRAALVLAVVTVTAACSAAGPPAAAPDPSTATTAPAFTPAEQAVLADYLAGWDALAGATSRLDPDDAALAELFRDPALAGARRFILGQRAGGQAGFDHLRHRARIASLEGSEAVVFDCTTDDRLVQNETGVGPASSEGKRGYDNRLRLEDGRWRTYEVSVFGSACL